MPELDEPKYYLNTQTGDVFITWFSENQLDGKENWVEISKVVYERFVYGNKEE